MHSHIPHCQKHKLCQPHNCEEYPFLAFVEHLYEKYYTEHKKPNHCQPLHQVRANQYVGIPDFISVHCCCINQSKHLHDWWVDDDLWVELEKLGVSQLTSYQADRYEYSEKEDRLLHPAIRELLILHLIIYIRHTCEYVFWGGVGLIEVYSTHTHISLQKTNFVAEGHGWQNYVVVHVVVVVVAILSGIYLELFQIRSMSLLAQTLIDSVGVIERNQEVFDPVDQQDRAWVVDFKYITVGVELLLQQALEQATKVVYHYLFEGPKWRNKDQGSRWLAFEFLCKRHCYSGPHRSAVD